MVTLSIFIGGTAFGTNSGRMTPGCAVNRWMPIVLKEYKYQTLVSSPYLSSSSQLYLQHTVQVFSRYFLHCLCCKAFLHLIHLVPSSRDPTLFVLFKMARSVFSPAFVAALISFAPVAFGN